MKIAYIMNAPIPSKRANSVHVMKMCQAFKKNGVDIELFCEGDESDESILDDVFKQYAVNYKFPINRTMVSNISRQLKYSFLITALKMTRSIIRKEYDLLYGRSLIGIYLLRNKHKFIYESHISPINSLFKLMEKSIIYNKNCIGFVVISEALKQEYLRIFPQIDSNKIIVLHDGADLPSKYKKPDNIIQNSNSTSKDVVIGYLGHLYPGKCMEVLVQIAKRRKHYFFHIVGGTEDWVKYWHEEIQSSDINNIKLYGYVENRFIGDYYSNFDICMLPFSRDIFFSNKKNRNIGQWISPLKLFEAMSYGKAIIASKLPTIEEVLKDEDDAMLADPDNIDEWVAKLDMLVYDENLRYDLGQKALEKFKCNYTWDKRVERIIEIFNGYQNDK